MTTKNPGKNRLSQSKAPIHVKRKRMRARLITNDPNLQNIRTVTAVSYTHLTLPTILRV